MTDKKRNLFVTTALPYANGPFHIGHIMEYIQADIWVRHERMCGNNVHWVGADDTHGAPIMIAAQKKGITPQQFVAEIAAGRKEYLDDFYIKFDFWHSTDSPENHELSQDIYRRLKAAGLIYTKDIEQFYDTEKNMFLADRFIKGTCPKCGGAKLTQDPDTLDTWFSSALWPFSTLGWPNENAEDYNYFYPTNTLVTGYDIIFFWVARMIMAGYEYRGEKPFGHVYFTGIVRDKIGRKMSKQLGNSPDPLDLIAQFGADGMRVAMLLSSSAGNDVMFDEALCEQGRNFGNKIWNAYRLVNGWTIDDALAQSENNRLAIEWFRQALAKTLRQVESDFASYRISEAFMNLYKLFWDDFSGWYLEMIKPAYQCPIDRPTLEATCGFFDDLLRLLHPFMPFVTEEIWQDLAPRKAGESIMVQRMPEAREIDEALLGRFELTKEVVTAVRNVRKQKNIPQKDPLTLRVIADENYPAEYAPVLQKMGNLSQIETTREKDPSAVGFLVKTTQYFVPMEGMIDIEAERKKLAGELEYLEGFLASVQKKLSNERFVSSAPEKVVANERTKQADTEAKIAALREQLAALK